MTEYTPEQKAEFEKRVQEFNGELIAIYKKYNVGIMPRPVLKPEGTIGADLVWVDKLYAKKEEEAKPEENPAEKPADESVGIAEA